MPKQSSIVLILMGLLFLTGCGGNTPAPATLTPTEFFLPTPGRNPDRMTAGPDGNLWFTEASRNKIARLTLGR